MELQSGAVFAGHRVEGVVGRGGMGVVYRATHLALDRIVALKVIRADYAGDEAFRERFRREARLAASIEHPNVLPVMDAGEDDGVLYITMRFIAGIDLGALISSSGRLAPERVATIAIQISGALDAAHAEGLIHRDVKPANILLEGAEGLGRSYLTDFGLTRRAASGPALTQTGSGWEPSATSHPSRSRHSRSTTASTSTRSPACSTRRSPAGLPSPARLMPPRSMPTCSEPPPDLRETLSGAPAGVSEALQRGMAKDPDERFASAGALGSAVASALVGRTAAPATAPARTPAKPAAAMTEAARSPTPPPADAAAGSARAGSPVASRVRPLWIGVRF